MKSDFEYIENKIKTTICDNNDILEVIRASEMKPAQLAIFVEIQKLNIENLKLLKELYKDNLKNEDKPEADDGIDMKKLSTLIEGE